MLVIERLIRCMYWLLYISSNNLYIFLIFYGKIYFRSYNLFVFFKEPTTTNNIVSLDQTSSSFIFKTRILHTSISSLYALEFPYEVLSHISEYYPFELQTKQFQITIHTFTSNSATSTVHISTGRHSIIYTHTLQMPKQMKPSQSAMPHHLSYTLNTQKTVQILTSLSIMQVYTSHIPLTIKRSALSRLQIFSYQRLCFSPVCQHTLGFAYIYYIKILISFFSKYNSMHAGSLMRKWRSSTISIIFNYIYSFI